MLELPETTIIALPVDQLGLLVLDDLVASGEWNEHNYTNAAAQKCSNAACRAIAEAMGWLRARGLIARQPGQTSTDSIFVTRFGQQVRSEGAPLLYATESLHGLHPLVEREARTQFLLGKYDLAVFAAMKVIEIRVRALAQLGDDVHGVDVFNQAFGDKGRLTDPNADRGEREGLRALLAGAYAVLRNPAGHREVDYTDVTEAADAVHTASLLMKLLDSVEIPHSNG
jgi:uncharacterized protein (TIGR02391 family)